jgi:hypothetical protein
MRLVLGGQDLPRVRRRADPACRSRPGQPRKTGNSPRVGTPPGRASRCGGREAAAAARLRRLRTGRRHPADRIFQLSSPQRCPIDAVRRGRATATMGHRCCGNDIHGPSLRYPGPAEQHQCPIVAVAAPGAGGQVPGMPGAGDLNGGHREPGAYLSDRQQLAHRLALPLDGPPAPQGEISSGAGFE